MKWSDGEHPGHLVFPIYFRLLGGDSEYFEHEVRHHAVDIDELESLTADCDEPCLPNPSVDAALHKDDGAFAQETSSPSHTELVQE